MFAGSPLTYSTSIGSPLSASHNPTTSGSSLEDSLALAPSATSNSNLFTHNPSSTHGSNSGPHSPSTLRASGSPLLRNSLDSSPAGSSLEAGQSRSALLAARGSCPSSSDADQVGDHTFPSSGSLLDLSDARAPSFPTSSLSHSIPLALRMNEAGSQLTRLPGSSVDEDFKQQNSPVRFSAEGALISPLSGSPPLEIALDENSLKIFDNYSTVDQGSGFEIDSTPQNRSARDHVDAGSVPPANQVESLLSVPAVISDSHFTLCPPRSGDEAPSGRSSAGARDDQVETPSLSSPVSQSSSASFFPTMGSSSVSVPASALPARRVGRSRLGSSKRSKRYIEDYFGYRPSLGADASPPSPSPSSDLSRGINPRSYQRYKKIPTPRVVSLNLDGISAGHTATARRRRVRRVLKGLAKGLIFGSSIWMVRLNIMSYQRLLTPRQCKGQDMKGC